ISAGTATQLSLTGFPSPATAGAPGSFTVTALDAFGNIATGFTGTLHFTSTDAIAALPSDATLTNGTCLFSATLKTAGIQSLTAAEVGGSGLTATQSSIAVNPA